VTLGGSGLFPLIASERRFSVVVFLFVVFLVCFVFGGVKPLEHWCG